MVSVEQISALVNFMETYPELAFSRCTRTKEGRRHAYQLWTECANVLNSVASDGVQKSPDSWRIYYNEYKSKLYKRIKAEKGEIEATGAPAKKIMLTPLQERLHTILERDVGELLPGVRHNPLSVCETSTLDDSQEKTFNSVSHQSPPKKNSQKKTKKTDSCDIPRRYTMSSGSDARSEDRRNISLPYKQSSKNKDDHYHWAMSCVADLRKMERTQQVYAKKAIAEILMEGQLGHLNRNSVKVNELAINYETCNPISVKLSPSPSYIYSPSVESNDGSSPQQTF